MIVFIKIRLLNSEYIFALFRIMVQMYAKN